MRHSLSILATATVFSTARTECGRPPLRATVGRRSARCSTQAAISWIRSRLRLQMRTRSMLAQGEHLPTAARFSLPPTMGRSGRSTICRWAAPESMRFRSIPPTLSSPTPWSTSLALRVVFSGLRMAARCGLTSAAPFPICRSGPFRSTIPPCRARFISEPTMAFIPAPIWE